MADKNGLRATPLLSKNGRDSAIIFPIAAAFGVEQAVKFPLRDPFSGFQGG